MVSILSTQGKKNSPSPRNTTHPKIPARLEDVLRLRLTPLPTRHPTGHHNHTRRQRSRPHLRHPQHLPHHPQPIVNTQPPAPRPSTPPSSKNPLCPGPGTTPARLTGAAAHRARRARGSSRTSRGRAGRPPAWSTAPNRDKFAPVVSRSADLRQHSLARASNRRPGTTGRTSGSTAHHLGVLPESRGVGQYTQLSASDTHLSDIATSARSVPHRPPTCPTRAPPGAVGPCQETPRIALIGARVK